MTDNTPPVNPSIERPQDIGEDTLQGLLSRFGQGLGGPSRSSKFIYYFLFFLFFFNLF